MFVECIRPFGEHVAGDIAEVPDGSEVSPIWFKVIEPPASAQEG